MLREAPILKRVRNGDRVRIRRNIRLPYAGRSGVLCAITIGDPYGTHLVRFEDGLKFRYWESELELANYFPSSSFATLAAS
jgi:hypothetical protein